MILLGVAVVLLMLSPRMQDRVLSHASTNLHNLAHGRIGTLLGSVFVTETGPIYFWLPGLVSLLALAELLWCSRQLVVAFLIGHVGATLLVAAGLVAAVRCGWLPISVARATDVGISYGAVAVLGALTKAITHRWRQVWIGWWLAVALAGLFWGQDFTAVGHAVALVLGIMVSTRFGEATRWTMPRIVLLVVGVAFGYLMLANAGTSMLGALVLGVLGAGVADWITRRRRTRPTVALQSQELSRQR